MMLEGKWMCRKCRHQNYMFSDECELCGHDIHGNLTTDAFPFKLKPVDLKSILFDIHAELARECNQKLKVIISSDGNKQYRGGFEDGIVYALHALEAHINKLRSK